MPKMHVFEKKKLKSPKRSRGRTRIVIQYFITSENNKVPNSKCTAFNSSAILRLFFTSNSTVLVGGGAKISFVPERRVI